MIVDWQFAASRRSRARVEYADAFDARGMKRGYGRGNHFGK